MQRGGLPRPRQPIATSGRRPKAEECPLYFRFPHHGAGGAGAGASGGGEAHGAAAPLLPLLRSARLPLLRARAG
eukprot:scaffold94599_cov45-Phaeocystis_antarctica.AAC.1